MAWSANRDNEWLELVNGQSRKEIYSLALVGCSTAISSNRRILGWDSSLRSLISRRAVMGN